MKWEIFKFIFSLTILGCAYLLYVTYELKKKYKKKK